ncbi:MAG: hypothetical protein JNN12_04140 [Bacteroidetes Order II. Incertae sedis bacterium]|nr:hypothetical protein [Bacteroidetes Order II. bacterium]
MYTAYIGRKLVTLYNQRKNTNLSVEAFFDTVFYPLFFDNARYLLHVHNALPFQHSKFASDPIKRKNTKMELHKLIQTAAPNGSTFVGAAASGVDGTTSGQVTSLNLGLSTEDSYASWIGAGLGIGLEGGYSILIDSNEVIWATYEGWQQYRNRLIDTPNQKGNQINTWNGVWLSHCSNRRFNSDSPMLGFDYSMFQAKGDQAGVKTQSWIKVIFALANQHPNQNLIAYVYSLGQMNKTIGFIQINLPQVKRLNEIYSHLVKLSEFEIAQQQLEDVYDTEFSFKRACMLGSIGLQALEPSKLREIMTGKKSFKPPKDEATAITFTIYQTWITAMLDNKQLLEKSQEIAKHLRAFVLEDRQGKTTRKNLVDKILDASSRKAFIENLKEAIQSGSLDDQFFDDIVTEIMFMPADHFPLFMTLIRFKYAIESNK